MDNKDNRREWRIGHLCEVECEGGGASRFNSRINDISTSGAFIDAMIHFPEGTKLGLRFQVGGIEINVRGEVCHSTAGIGFGVRFLDLTPEHRAVIESLVIKGAVERIGRQGADVADGPSDCRIDAEAIEASLK